MPSCAGTMLSLNTETGKLRCHSCRNELEHQKFEKTVADISQLDEVVIGAGATAIFADTEDVLTFKCGACSAEVVVDTSETLQARCHWCRSTLSINHQIPNGAVPDKVLPFCTTKEKAQAEISKFVKKRSFWAKSRFKKEFCAENVIGVYLPYMVIDVNASATLIGQGEINIETTDKKEHSVFTVKREFDFIVENLTTEADMGKQAGDFEITTNSINALKPFDIENSVQWDANFMKGFNSQRRNVNIADLRDLSVTKIKDIARHQALKTIEDYSERGVRWDDEQLDIKGKQWKAVYLPVWLYSYRQKVNKWEESIHYVAVNGCNLETKGSVPIKWTKLLFAMFGMPAIVIISAIVGFFTLEEGSIMPTLLGIAGLIGIVLGFVLWGFVFSKYRDGAARFAHEDESNVTMSNLLTSNSFVKKVKTDDDHFSIEGRNDHDANYVVGLFEI